MEAGVGKKEEGKEEEREGGAGEMKERVEEMKEGGGGGGVEVR